MDHIKTFEIGGVDWCVNTLTGKLLTISSSPLELISLHIPRFLPKGVEITSISSNVLRGNFDKVSFDGGIKVEPRAFEHSKVNTVVWPTENLEIPYACFYCSSVKQIFGIENVVQVDFKAFSHSDIEKFKWPDGAKIIPPRCFEDSKLKEIEGVDNVCFIGAYAFCNTDLRKLDLACSSVLKIEAGAFSNMQKGFKLTSPYYMSEYDFACVFISE